MARPPSGVAVAVLVMSAVTATTAQTTGYGGSTTVPSSTVGGATPSPGPSTSAAPAKQDDGGGGSDMLLPTSQMAMAAAALFVLLMCAVILAVRRRRRRRQREKDARRRYVDNPGDVELEAVHSPGELNTERRTDAGANDSDAAGAAVDRPSGGGTAPGDGSAPWEEGTQMHHRQTRRRPLDKPYDPPSSDAVVLRRDLDRMPIVDVPLSQVQQLQTIETGESPYLVRRAIYTEGRGKSIEATVKSIAGPGTGVVSSKLLDLLREVAAVSQFSHRNVVALIGVVWKGTPLPGHPMVLYEHMSLGPLDRYLRKARPTPARRLAMCANVGSGVQYLRSVGYVIGNLSSKVVMVDRSEECKIGDFFICRDISDPGAPLPRAALSWFAPELYRQCDMVSNATWRKSGDSGLADRSLAGADEEPRRPSHEADVWALGMLMWEIFENAEIAPYHKYPATKIPKLVREGHRPGAPPECPRDVYELMIDCWHPLPEQRPTPEQVVAGLPASLADGPVGASGGGSGTAAADNRSSKLFVDLQERYRDSGLLSGVSPRMSNDSTGEGEERERSPSPLIHMSLVGLKKGDAADAKEKVIGFSTVSSRPSNYTSGTGSTRSTHSDRLSSALLSAGTRDQPAFVHDLFGAPSPPDDGPLPPTMLESPRHSRDIADAGGADAAAAADSYLFIGPAQPRPESSVSEGPARLRRSASARGASRRSLSPERRKSALALALEGVSNLDDESGSPEPMPPPPSWVQSVRRRSATLRSTAGVDPAMLESDPLSTSTDAGASGGAASPPVSASGRTRSPSGAAAASEPRLRSAKGAGVALSGGGAELRRATLPAGGTGDSGARRARSVGSGGAAKPSTGDASVGAAREAPNKGGWFKRSRRSSSATQPTDDVGAHSSPEPGALPGGPFVRHSRATSAGGADARDVGFVPPRESPSPLGTGSIGGGGLTLTASALQRIERRRSTDFQLVGDLQRAGGGSAR